MLACKRDIRLGVTETVTAVAPESEKPQSVVLELRENARKGQWFRGTRRRRSTSLERFASTSAGAPERVQRTRRIQMDTESR
jgi:hypothetical protein